MISRHVGIRAYSKNICRSIKCSSWRSHASTSLCPRLTIPALTSPPPFLWPLQPPPEPTAMLPPPDAGNPADPTPSLSPVSLVGSFPPALRFLEAFGGPLLRLPEGGKFKPSSSSPGAASAPPRGGLAGATPPPGLGVRSLEAGAPSRALAACSSGPGIGGGACAGAA